MQTNDLQAKNAQKINYVSPLVSVISVNIDILTDSHNDPNMGEWDTE